MYMAFQAAMYSSVAFWLGVLIILIRRPMSPTKGDLAYIRWGLLVIVPIGVPAFLYVWSAKGF